MDLVYNWVVKEKPALACFAETHVTDNIGEGEIYIDGYSIESCNSFSRHTGGVLMYIRNDVRYELIEKYAFSKNFWIMSVNVGGTVVAIVYHSPNASHKDFLDSLEDWFDQMLAGEGKRKFILLGDFNINLKIWSTYSIRLKNIIDDGGLRQIIKKPTRVTSESESLIDLVVTNSNCISAKVCDRPNISDHKTIEIKIGEIQERVSRQDYKNTKILLRKKLISSDFEFMNQVLLEKEWGAENDLDILANRFVENMVDSLNTVAPKKIVIINGTLKPKPWFNDIVSVSQKLRDDSYIKAQLGNSVEEWQNYKTNRNNFVTILRREKKAYFEEKIDRVRNDSREMWKTLKKVTDERKTVNKQSGLINFPNSLDCDEESVASKFNNYFVDSIIDIAENIKHPDHEVIEMETNIEEGNALNTFQPIDIKQLKNIVLKLPNKAGTEEGLTAEILKKTFWRCGHALLNIVNMSITQGIVPIKWLRAQVIPIPKVGKAKSADEFRPVNMLPIYEKVLEKVIYHQLIEYFTKNNTVHPNQSGFRSNHSCETAIQLVLEKWVNELDNGKILIAVFLDFKRAFETVDRKLLLVKLWKYGVRGQAYKWFESYLTNRSQVTIYDNETSSEIENNLGVPQGSVLGPLLFLIYINDIFGIGDLVFLNLFADDTLIWYSGDDMFDICKRINLFLIKVADWLRANKLKLNINKSKCMWIMSSLKAKAKILKEQNFPSIEIENDQIQCVEEFKYLGIIIDENLTMKKNYKYVIKKINKKIGFIIRIGRYLSIKTKLSIYKAIILPHIDYCGTLLWGMDKKSLKKFQKLQSRILKAILKCDRFTPTAEVLGRVQMLSVQQRITLNVLVFIHKIINNLMPNYMLEYLNTVTKTYCYNTRQVGDININRKKKSRTQRSVFYSGVRLYNQLNNVIKNELDVNNFKILCESFVKERFPIN